MKIDAWLARAARAAPDRPALVEGGASVSYGDLDALAASAARRLAGLGARAGDRVALAFPPGREQVILLHALMKLGAVAVPLDPRRPAADLEEDIARAGATLVVNDPERVVAAPEAASATLVEAHDHTQPHCLIHTSGTAGRPAAVELTYGNHLWSALGSAARIGTVPADRWLCCLPLHHVGGLSIVLRCVIFGATVVLEPFEPDGLAAMLPGAGVTLASLVPTMLGGLLDAGAELAGLRAVLLGGGPAPAALLDRALGERVPLAPTYGMTEAASQVATLPPSELPGRPGSCGPPIAGTELAIEPSGRILVRGPTVAPGAAGTGGWLRTGDLGRLDEDGYLTVLGRADDVILTGGENVTPEEVERVLVGHPGVTDAAVGARMDPRWGQAVVAWVVPAPGAAPSDQELRAHCRARLAPHQVPKAFDLVTALPRNEQGKLLRQRLGARTAAGPATPAHPPRPIPRGDRPG